MCTLDFHLVNDYNYLYVNVDFSSCFRYVASNFLIHRTDFFLIETSFHQLSNMASSGLKKMFSQ